MNKKIKYFVNSISTFVLMLLMTTGCNAEKIEQATDTEPEGESRFYQVAYLCGDPEGPNPNLYRNNIPYDPDKPIETFCSSEILGYTNTRIYVPGDQGYGELSGKVIDEKGLPVNDAIVYIAKRNPLYPVVYTDREGRFSMTVPSATSRHIVRVEKEGYIPDATGNFQIWKDSVTDVTIKLLSNKVPDADIYSEDLVIKGLYVVEIDVENDKILPVNEDAVIDPSLYPEHVKPYLSSGIYSNYNSAEVQNAINEIMNSIPSEDLSRENIVAQSAFAWKATNVFRETYAFQEDPTAANKLGMWAKNMEDWLFTAEESILRKRAICIDSERVMVALLRGLSIPARVTPVQAHPTTQVWIQLRDGRGYWANIEASKATKGYVTDHDNLTLGFPSRYESEINLIPINGEKTPAAYSIDLKNETLFQEELGYKYFDTTEHARAEIHKMVDNFKKTGDASAEPFNVINPGTTTCSESCYKAFTTGFSYIKLANLGEQRILNASFPLANAPRKKLCNLSKDAFECKPLDQATGRLAVYYTNHPEWVVNQKVVTEKNNITGISMKLLKVKFDLTLKCKSDRDCAKGRVCNPHGICIK